MNKRRILNLVSRSSLFALILSLGTMVTLMAGETQGLALANLSGASVQTIATAAQGDVVYAALTGGPQPTGVYRSGDKGRTWQVISPGPGVAVTALAVYPANQAMLYAGTGGGPANTTNSLWLSDSGGQIWRKFPLGLPLTAEGMTPGVTALAVDPNQAGVLYVGTDGHGVYRFETDRGSYGYELIGGVSLYTAHVSGLVLGPESRLYALTDNGLFATDGEAWQLLALPEQVVSLAVASDDPQRLYAGGISTGLYRSSDGGQTWEQVKHGLDMVPGAALRITALAVDVDNPSHVAAATAYGAGNRFAPGGVYKSRDSGYSWAKLAETDGVVTQLTIQKGIIYGATPNGLARYGVQIEQRPQPPLLNLHLPPHLSGIQMLILTLTLVLAGIALVGRIEWVAGKKAQIPGFPTPSV